jgi:hypothetical protein
MSQHDMDIANAGGAAVRADLNLALVALVGQNSGATAPATTFAYMWWADTTTGILKQRNAANSAWVSILNLATGLPISVTQIFPITASVAANALTLTLNPTSMDFRNASLGSGTVTTVTAGSAVSTVVSSGSTGGSSNGVKSRLAVLALNNAGTIELAWCNAEGGLNLDETTLVSTTAEGGAGAADSINVIYSTTARSNVAFRVVGFVESTQATAGTWATAPSTIQGAGGTGISQQGTLLRGTAQNTTSGTSFDFTGIPTWANEVTITLVGVSVSGTSPLLVQLGTVSGVETSGYLGSAGLIQDAAASAASVLTSGFLVSPTSSAAATVSGSITFLRHSGTTWVAGGSPARSDAAVPYHVGGHKVLATTLDRVRLTTVNGTDTFDAGSANVVYKS